MTPQEILNKSYLGVMKQNQMSVRENGGCAYRGTNWTKCAIGHLIGDQAAMTWDKLDNGSIHDIISSRSKYVETWMVDNQRLLCDLQRVHDRMLVLDSQSFRSVYKREMQLVATRHGLELPETTLV